MQMIEDGSSLWQDKTYIHNDVIKSRQGLGKGGI